jgi:hypothetical protein
MSITPPYTYNISLLFILSLSLAACGGGGGPSNSSDSTDGTTTTTDDGTNVTTGTDSATLVPALGVVSGSTFTDAVISVGVTDLSAGGSTSVSVNIVDTASSNAVIVGAQYGIRFSSECAELDPPKATFQDAELLTTSGVASTFYKAEGCSGEDRITATLFESDGGNITGDTIDAALATVTVALAEVNNIEYVDASSPSIALKGLGFSVLPETSAISFAVKDEFNNPISGKTVTFTLSNSSVGATLAGDSDANGSVEGLTDGNGIAIAYVNSGSTHASISVKASTTKNTGGIIGTQSFPIAVTTGVVDQNSFNLVVDTRNPHSWDIDGTEIDFSVRGSDAFQNPIPDGTVINFIAESGQILPTCTISGGGCSVKWASTHPRPGVILDPAKSDGSLILKTNANGFPGYDAGWQGGRAGVATILAYTLGEAGYPDSGGNGLLDVGESYYGLAEAFLDANEDGNFDPAIVLNPQEKLIDFDSNGVQTAAPINYQGVSCTAGAIAAGHCSELVHVRDTLSIIVADGNAARVTLTGISGSVTPNLTAASCINVRDEAPVIFNFNVADSNGNIPPIDTQVAFTAEGFELVGSAPKNVPEGYSTSGINYSVAIKNDTTFENGNVSFEVTSVTDDVTSWTSQTLTDDPRIVVTSDSYFLDVPTPTTKSATYTFTDACGSSPAAGDIILFELANGLFTQTPLVATATNKFQFSGADLTSGQLTLVFEDDGTPSPAGGDMKITTIKDGFSSETTYSITD